MSAPRKTAGAAHFEAQLDAVLPTRKKPDGWIADANHTGTSSHHADDTAGSKPEWNGDPDTTPEVRALDIATPLTAEVSGVELVHHLVGLKKLEVVIRYLIHAGFIYHERVGFKPAKFAGDPHPTHVHITFAFTQAADNNTTFDYRFGDLVSLSSSDRTWMSGEIKKQSAAAVAAAVPAIATAVLREFRTSQTNLSDTAMNELEAVITRAILVDQEPVEPYPFVASRMGIDKP